jgi:antirestriction protein ArdC
VPPSPEIITNPFTSIERAEQIMAGMPHKPDIRHGGNEACYSPMLDYVKLPEPSAFQSPEEYYATAYHELVHSTGHASRVGRKGILEPSFFGSHEYSKEELVAEMGAAFLCGVAGIEQRTIENSASYISGWLKALKNDRKLLVMAAAQAQHAVDYILSRSEGEDDQAEDSAA